MKHEFTTCDWCGEVPKEPTQEMRIASKIHDFCKACLGIFADKLEKCGKAALPELTYGQLGVSTIPINLQPVVFPAAGGPAVFPVTGGLWQQPGSIIVGADGYTNSGALPNSFVYTTVPGSGTVFSTPATNVSSVINTTFPT